MSKKFSELDESDRIITKYLSNDASITNASLGKLVGLSSSAVHERVRKLKKLGALKKIVACIDSEFMDMSVCSFIYAHVDGAQNTKNFLDAILAHSSILECYHVTGEYSYLLKVRTKDAKALDYFITTFLKNLPGLTKTKVDLVLSSFKDSSIIADI